MSPIKKIMIILCTALVIGAMYLNSPYKSWAEMQSGTFHTVQAREITDYLTLRGSVVERKRRELYPQYMSRVLSVSVLQGETVSKGQALMTLQTESERASMAVFYSELQQTIQNYHFNRIKPTIPEDYSYATEPTEYTIVSPIDGIVMDIFCQVGETVSGIFPCIAVSDLNMLGVEAEVSEENSNKLERGMDCEITVASVTELPFGGYISGIAPYAATSTALLEQDDSKKVSISAEINRPSAELRPGYSADLRVQIGDLTSSIVIPYHCLAQDAEGEYVLCLGDNGTLVRQNIISGRELKDGVEILDGLMEGWQLIEYPENYQEGKRVKLK